MIRLKVSSSVHRISSDGNIEEGTLKQLQSSSDKGGKSQLKFLERTSFRSDAFSTLEVAVVDSVLSVGT